MSAPHPAIGLTSAVALAAAATIPGSLIHDLAPASPTYRIGTLSGHRGAISESAGTTRAVAFRRNSRRIVDALVYIPAAAEPGNHPAADTEHQPPVDDRRLTRPPGKEPGHYPRITQAPR